MHPEGTEKPTVTDGSSFAPAAATPEASREILVSEDRMQAVLRIRTSHPHSLLYEDVVELLDQKHIVYGIFGAEIKKHVEAYNQSMAKNPNQDLPVARGDRPQPGRDGRIDILVEPPQPVTFDDHGRADFRNVNRYRTVDKGQVLAKLTPPTAGKPGIDIFGQEIKPPEPATPELEDGPNVSFVPGSNEYIAREHGIFIHENNRIDVNPVLIVPGSVGLESGNVHYDGTVQIGGNIERAAMVSAIGDVEVGGAIESGEFRSGGSLTVKKGINTKREHMVRVGGDLQAVYVDNSNLTVDGHVVVHKSVITSQIVCYGDISVTGSGSALSGGEIYAFGSVSADFIGNRTGVLTKIYLGDHQKNKQYYQLHIKELEQVEKDLEKLKEKVVKIKQYVQRMRGKIPVQKQAEFRVIYKAYKDQVELRERVQKQVVEFRESRYNQDSLRLIARNTLFPGVEIHYRDHVEKIKTAQTRVSMRFTPGLERPQLEAWKG
ncbi:MAG: FapA family protein [bacterium]|nr:FapA family protein [bacterium]